MEQSTGSGDGTMAWIWVLVAFLVITAGLRGVMMFGGAYSLPIARSFEDLDELIGDGLAEALEEEDSLAMRAVYLVVAACIATQLVGVELAQVHDWKLRFGCIAILAWRAAAVLSHVVTFVLDSKLDGRSNRATKIEKRKSVISGTLAARRSHRWVCTAVKILIHVLAAVVVFDNLGVEVSGFVSYVGVIGLVFSLGAQYVLQDLLGYVALMVDASVVVGDSVVVGSDPKGAVEAMGPLATKVRTLEGELLIYRNQYFASKVIMNCSRQPHRLVTLNFELAAPTTSDCLEVARSCAKTAVEEVAASTSNLEEDLGGRVTWAEHNMRYSGVYVTSLAEGSFKGIQYILYFYLDGTANKFMQLEATSLVYTRLASLLEEKGIQTQGAFLAASLSKDSLLFHNGKE